MLVKLLSVCLFTVVNSLAGQDVSGNRVLLSSVADKYFHPSPSSRPPDYDETTGCKHDDEECVLSMRCPAQSEGSPGLQHCTTAFGTKGVCCRLEQNNLLRVRSKRSPGYDDYEHVSINAVREGHREYAEKMRCWKQSEKVGRSERRLVNPPFHQLLQPAQPESESEPDQHDVYEELFASRTFAEMTNMSVEERQLDRFVGLPRELRKRCAAPVNCNPHVPYRSFDGTCNNAHPERTSWGAAEQPFQKLLPPAYEDGVWAPRIHSTTGSLLASPRTISATVLHDIDRPDANLNLLLMQFGQFLAHDFSRSSSIKIGKEEIECCSQDKSHALHGDQAHFACLPIDVSPRDPFYGKFGVRCLNFVRLALAQDGRCRLGYAKQVNKVTHFIDASAVYGSNSELAAALRTFENGFMRNSFPARIELPPFNRNPSVCEPWARACFEAGDDRSNQIISLVQVHTLFIREHNRIAGILGQVNPQWNDEKIYQETRKIVIGELQNIVFNEYLPIVVGAGKARQYGLLDLGHGHTNQYNPNLKPTVLSEVTGAAFRFAHSTVDGHLHIQHRHSRAENIPIHTVFNDPSRVVHPTSFDDYMFSLGNQAQQQVDDAITTGLAGMLFAGRAPFGSDLASLNIQRGRDHALRPYNDYRAWAGLPTIQSFHEFGPVGSRLAQVYASPNDVDLWVGGLLEDSQPDGLVGETFANLIAEQFARLKYGDRYYFTEGLKNNPGAFTPSQLEQIQRVTMASLICANVDEQVNFDQAPRAFLRSGSHNMPIPCKQYHNLDFGAWKD
ncbi:chorion peroxidase-like [Topomyia yanbarensis]|uniref:chorion peroxidase-like n=1 Tax=Topomyia yanbarensis TaxID=2498891 RepID=UPI00273B1EB0|nr:chorion peroxidase-like [Topomyia yanbarensis]XP_058812591.1 chorion peroxidase-like [Topomyia yanbarensis]